MRTTLTRLATLALAFLAAANAHADEPPGLAPGTGETAPAPFVWRVDGPAGPSWLLGTVHVGVSLADLPPVVNERLIGARTVVLEADIREIDVMGVLERVRLPEGTRLDAHLRPDVWSALQAQLGLFFPGDQLVQLQPWFLESVLVTTAMPTLAPMDLAILQQSAARGQELRFLETWQEQLELMNGVPLEQSVEDLTRWFDEREVVLGELSSLIDSYRAGDLAGVEAVVLSPDELTSHPELYEVTLFARNERWLPALETLANQGSAFVAVGLGHLLGERGLVALLRQRGFTVERLQ